jgi:hypothetical protein
MGDAERGRMLMVMTSFHHQNLIKMQSDLYQAVVHLCGCSALEASANFNYTPSQLNTLHKINIHARACIHTIGTRVEILYSARRLQNYNSSTSKNNNTRPSDQRSGGNGSSPGSVLSFYWYILLLQLSRARSLSHTHTYANSRGAALCCAVLRCADGDDDVCWFELLSVFAPQANWRVGLAHTLIANNAKNNKNRRTQ